MHGELLLIERRHFKLYKLLLDRVANTAEVAEFVLNIRNHSVIFLVSYLSRF
jgi:hypothetical protein